jgi:hypothetical protein
MKSHALLVLVAIMNLPTTVMSIVNPTSVNQTYVMIGLLALTVFALGIDIGGARAKRTEADWEYEPVTS